MILLALCTVLVLQTIAASPASAATFREHRMYRLVNLDRHRHGVFPLRFAAGITRFARQHSRQMAEHRTLFHHSCLDCIRRRHGWSDIGENVGYASTVWQLNRLFMNSAPHRANILCTCFRMAGIGVVRSRGYVWVTELFYRP